MIKQGDSCGKGENTFCGGHFWQGILGRRGMKNCLGLLLAVTTIASESKAQKAPNWVKVADQAAWQARDSQGELVYQGRLWILGGWFNSYQAAPRDVWSSGDGEDWTLVQKTAPWKHSDLSMAVVYRDRIFVLGGWQKERDNYGDVWYSKDGKNWRELQSEVIWKGRHEHSAFVFQDKIRVAGGHARPLSNEVWSLQIPKDYFDNK
jgi:hypothetical protein